MSGDSLPPTHEHAGFRIGLDLVERLRPTRSIYAIRRSLHRRDGAVPPAALGLERIRRLQSRGSGFDQTAPAAIEPGAAVVVVVPRNAGEVIPQHGSAHVRAGNSLGEDLEHAKPRTLTKPLGRLRF